VLDGEPVPPLGRAAEHVPGLLLAAQAAAAPDRPRGQPGEGHGEAGSIRAPRVQADQPLPSQSHNLINQVRPPVLNGQRLDIPDLAKFSGGERLTCAVTATARSQTSRRLRGRPGVVVQGIFYAHLYRKLVGAEIHFVPNVLYRNAGGLLFHDWTQRSGLGPPSIDRLGFGTVFVDVAADRGIAFRHFDPATPQHYIQETMGSGLAWIDYDNDGIHAWHASLLKRLKRSSRPSTCRWLPAFPEWGWRAHRPAGPPNGPAGAVGDVA
jgi:hypothetical protein